jgi:hypothetical protein
VEDITYHGPQGVIFFGNVIAASADDITGSNTDSMKAVNPLLYGYGTYGKICDMHPWEWMVTP